MINIKSEYNFLDSYAKINNIVSYAKEKQMPYIGICDFATTFGNYRFYTECVNNGIKPVIGLEIKYKSQVYLFYAKNHNGIIRLNQINSKFLIDGKIVLNEIEPDIMLILERGKIVDSIIDNGSSKEKLNILKNIFKEDFYIGFITNVNEKSNFLIHEEIMKQNMKFINVDEVRFLKDKDLEIYTTLKAIKETKKVKDLISMKSIFSKYSIKEDQKDPNDSIIEFVNKVDIEYPKKELKPPEFKYVPSGLNSTEFLTQLANAGLNKRRDLNVDSVYLDRLNYELDVIVSMGFADYFLIVWDIVKHAKTHNIYVGPGRGSAAGSLVSYCLGITQIDPVYNNLIFERFLNPQRITMPDIDIDFEDIKRNDIVNYIIERFGSEYVCKIATVSKFLAKSTFKDVAKAWNIDSGRIESISKKLNSKLSFMDNLKENKKLRSEVIGNLQLERIIDIVEKIEGMPRQTSIHAAGIIIGHKKITDYCSVDFDNVAHAEAYELEALGLLKIDILALSNLTFIHDIVDKVNLLGGDIDLNKISLEDPKVFKLLSETKTLGIFQMESEGMRKTLQIVKPNSFAEIANVLALYRPGPKEFIADYVKNRNVFEFKGVIKDIVSDTHGIIIFQEQIILIATNMAGYTLAQADLLRRAISKKDSKKLNAIGNDFIKRSIANGYPKSEATMTFEMIAKFANYGFNKAHAYAYGMIVYQMAYLKVHYPEIFYSELFFFNFKSPKKLDFLMELEKQGIRLLAPDVITSDLKVSIEEKNLRVGFLVVDGIGLEVAQSIIENRQYLKNKDDLIEFVFEVLDKINISSTQVTKLIDAGAFDRYGYNRPTLKNCILSLLQTDAYSIYKIGGEIEIEQIADNSFDENCLYEKNALSINIKYDQFKEVLKQRQSQYNQKIYTIDEAFYNHVNLAELLYCDEFVLIKVISIKEIRTKKNELMCFLNAVSTQQYDITVFSKEYAQYSQLLNNSLNQYLLCEISLKEDRVILKKL